MIQKQARKKKGKIIVNVGDKGGIGKSLTAVNLAHHLRADFVRNQETGEVFQVKIDPYRPLPIGYEFAYEVALLDGDSQGDTTKCIWGTMPDELQWIKDTQLDPMIPEHVPYSMTKLLTDETVLLQDCLHYNSYGLAVLPANISLDPVDSNIAPTQVRSLFVEFAQELRETFDFVIVDTKRGGSRLTQSLIRVASEILFPLESSILAMEDTKNTIFNVERLRELNPQMQLIGILLTKRNRSVVTKFVQQELYETLRRIEDLYDAAHLADLKQRRPGRADTLQEGESIVGRYSQHILPIGIQLSRFHEQSPGARLPTRLYIEQSRQTAENHLSKAKGGLNEEDYQKALEDTKGYPLLAEMIGLDVPPELYLAGKGYEENEQQYQVFMQERRLAL